MELTFHPRVAVDISRIMNFYEDVGGEQLAQEFHGELRAYFLMALEAPQQYAIHTRDLRRVNLNRFPYHFFYKIIRNRDRVRVLVVRHHNRRPSLGMSRR